MVYIKKQIKPYPLGAHTENDNCIRFSFVSKSEKCGVILYNRKTGRRIDKISFEKQDRIGNIYCKYVEGYNPSEVTYQYYDGDKIIPDERARVFVGKHSYGIERNVKDLKAGFIEDNFEWEGDVHPKIPYESCVVYCMHVRGFTKHASSKVQHRGTFLGIVEKIPYLKEIGITTVELQPSYDFAEIPDMDERRSQFNGNMAVSNDDLDKYCPRKLNYWGYKKGFYYAPKSSYAYGDDASIEFKEMVKVLHASGIEVVMQFYFPKDVERHEIHDILNFWVLTYHVDGFHLMGENIPTTLIARDPLLADTKLWYYSFDTDNIYDNDEVPTYRNLAEYTDGYLYDMRKYLKGDENMLGAVLGHMRYNPLKSGKINYFTNYYGMTMMDMVSYDRKHNEPNGEDNRDGNNMNCSWNCGEEGKSRRKKIIALRKKQIKNAMAMLLLSQGTPLIFMGDEFGNSQNGNNNPYCQDNTVTWLDWRNIESNRDIHDFWCNMIKLRNDHPILHMPKALRMMDSISCGYPDLSYHGQNAWRAQLESYNRHVGVMYCGKYAKKSNGEEDSILFLLMNMYWEPRKLALPKLPKGMKWQRVLCTAVQDGMESAAINMTEQAGETEHLVPERTVEMVIAVKSEISENKKTSGRKKKAMQD